MKEYSKGNPQGGNQRSSQTGNPGNPYGNQGPQKTNPQQPSSPKQQPGAQHGHGEWQQKNNKDKRS